MIIYYPRLILATIAAIIIYTFSSLFFLLKPFHKNNSYYCNSTMALVIFKILGVKFTKRNTDRLKDFFDAFKGNTKTPIKVLISNHQHTIDLCTVGGSLPPGVVTVGKKSIAIMPFLGWAFVLAGNILINRQDRKSAFATMKAVKEKMFKKNVSVCIMPEGTRSWGKGLLKFKKGAFYLALDAQVPIVPVVISSIHKTVDFSRWNAGEIIVDILPEINVNGIASENLNDFIEKIRNMYIEHIKRLDQEIIERQGWSN
ncbi:MAG: 1-acylglycerol-3-phosphate O-acyltransferase [Oligoflexia bacterium]|nr:1-acylglycerol-3-phosphate O-acyltransferase [Oligoflexia bacterium]